ncbi:hypothetical protein ACFL35_16205 [Candidatus Riflebacteria bacterium]
METDKPGSWRLYPEGEKSFKILENDSKNVLVAVRETCTSCSQSECGCIAYLEFTSQENKDLLLSAPALKEELMAVKKEISFLEQKVEKLMGLVKNVTTAMALRTGLQDNDQDN